MDSIGTIFDDFDQNPHMSVADLVEKYDQERGTDMVVGVTRENDEVDLDLNER